MTTFRGEQIADNVGFLTIHNDGYSVGLYVRPRAAGYSWTPQARTIYSGRDVRSARRAIAECGKLGVRITSATLDNGSSFRSVDVPRLLQD